MASGIFLIASGCQSTTAANRAEAHGHAGGTRPRCGRRRRRRPGRRSRASRPSTLAGLAARLGIRSQSLYAHVDGLDGLLRDLALDSVRTLGDELRSSVIGRSGATRSRRSPTRTGSFARRHPGLYAATIRDPGDDDELRRRQPACRRGPHPGVASRSASPAPTRCTRTERCGRASTASSPSSTPACCGARPRSARATAA